jgi:hypothetical protein
MCRRQSHTHLGHEKQMLRCDVATRPQRAQQLISCSRFALHFPAAHLTPPNVACAVRLLREELQLLQEPGSYVGEVIKV